MSGLASKTLMGCFTLAVAACGGFGSEETTPPTPDGGTITPDGGPPPVGGPADFGLTLTAGAANQTVFVMQSRTATVPIKLVRRAASTGAVGITVAKLPKDATADPLTIAAGANEGTLTLRAAPTTPQGAFALELTAVEAVASGAKATAQLSTFVRGTPGTLDTTFGVGGVITEVFGAPTSDASDARVMKNGAIVVGGRRTNNLTLVRFTPAGVLDTTFGSGTGRANIAGAQGSLFIDVHEGATPADGFIACVGSGTTVFSVYRAKLDGTLDTTFNGTGEAPAALGLGNANGVQTLALADGSALVLSSHFTNKLAVVSRWKPNGTLDEAYGTAGTCQLSGSGTSGEVQGTSGMVLRPGGGVRVVLGLSTIAGVLKGCSPTGGADTTLGTAPDYFAGGEASVAFSPYFDGGIVYLNMTSWRRRNAGFVPDSGIGSFGAVSTAPITTAACVLTQADGGIVITGDTGAVAGSFTLLRFKANGGLDPDFGTAGVATIPVSAGGATVVKLVAQPDGRILALGRHDQNFEGLLARIWP